MPLTPDMTIRLQDTPLQRCAVMSTSGANGMDLVIEAKDEYLATLDAVNVCFDFLKVPDLLQQGNALESVFGCHIIRWGRRPLRA
jgi:hypothetical protein